MTTDPVITPDDAVTVTRTDENTFRWERAKVVTWTIPAHIYKRLHNLHEWSIAHVVGVPHSEQEFAVALLDGEIKRSERAMDEYEKAKRLIQEPENLIVER